MFSGMSVISFLDKSSSTKLMSDATSDGIRPISFSDRLRRRNRTNRNKFCSKGDNN